MQAKQLYLSVIIFALASTPAIAQTLQINGYVKNAATGEPLVGANVHLKEAKRGATANEKGYYSINVRAGTYTANVNYMGYVTINESIAISKNSSKDFSLQPDNVAIEAVTISGEKRANVTRSEMSVEKLNIQTIKRIPALMGEVDVIKTIMLLPGVQPAAEGTSSFSVRGGSPDQNLILFDNSPVYNASHLMGFFSVFNNDVVHDVKLYKGDIPAGYGGRLSSLLDITSKDGGMDKFSVNGGIGLISSRLEIDGPILSDKLSFMVAGRRTYADLFLPLAPDKDLRNARLHFYDLNGKLTWKVGEKDRLSLTGYYGKDVFGMGDNVAGMNFSNGTYSLLWSHRFSDRFFLHSSIIGTHYDYDLSFNMGTIAAKWISSINDYGLREDFTLLYGDHGSFKFGAAGVYHKVSPCDAGMELAIGSSPRIVLPNQYSAEYSVYAMNQHKLSDRLTLKYGLRATLFQDIGPSTVYLYDENYHLSDSAKYGKGGIYQNYWGLEPRLGAVYQLTDNSSVKASYSRTVQFMHLVSNSSAGSPLDVWVPSSPNIKPQSAQQSSLGYFHNFLDDAIETSVEVFYKYLNNLVDFKDHAQLMMNPLLEGEMRTGVGKAYGLELMVRKNTGAFTGWVSYTYSRSHRKVQTVNNNDWYRATFDKPHNLNIVLSYDITKRINLSANWTYSTGTPVTYPENQFVIPDGMFGSRPTYVPTYGSRNTYRMPDYHRLDLAATFELKKHGRYSHELNVSIYNAYGRHNSWFVTFREEENQPGNNYAESVYLFSIVPSITYNFKF
ncbi:MAG: TonB-dependent receptor [Prevotellaceae bacterium]|jgi:hypothetical protein|nr:TonB-dependent receptor [Prevotellaceae bacterium]